MQKKLEKIKDLQRPGKVWNELHLNSSDYLSRCFGVKESVEKRSGDLLSVGEFRMSYEAANRPLVITNSNLPWESLSKWTFSYLHQKHGQAKVKCGETAEGNSTYIKLEYFIEYLYDQTDDFPLYVFDEHFGETCPELIQDYSVPKYFPEDYFQNVKGRPPFRWLLLGPKRSGSQIHQDPLGTSAWNVSIKGHKLWALFPPQTSKHILKVKNAQKPFLFFKQGIPTIRKKFLIKPILFIQNPGDIVFVPSKWWHAVLNLTDTIAVTQNFVSRCNFDSVWRMTRKQRKKFFERWKKRLLLVAPELWERGKLLDEIDEWG